MPPATQTQQTLGSALRANPTVRKAIGTLVTEVRNASSAITDIRGPRAGLTESYESFMASVGEVRGRGLYYPYIGSGLGNGALVELADGSIKWDMIGSIGVNFFGHSDPDLIEEALIGGLDDVVKHGNLQSNEDAYHFANKLVECASRNSSLKHCFLTTGGALANENALKICYHKHRPASRVIIFRDCFMGRTCTMAQLGDTAAYRQGIPLTVGVDYMPFYDEVAAEHMGHTRFIDIALMHLEQYIERYPNQHAAFVFELIQGEGGFNTATHDYFQALMECCKANSIAVWDDEIQTFGRTTSMFAYEHLELGEYIDVLSVAKMTQASATLFTERYNPAPGLLSGTFSGETSSFRVGRRILERLDEPGRYGDDGLHARHHALFTEQVRSMAAKHPDWFPAVPEVRAGTNVSDFVGGQGGMMRMTPFAGDKAKIVKACNVCYDEGVILFYCGHGPYHMRMLPPLGVMKEADWPRVFEVVERAFTKVAG